MGQVRKTPEDIVRSGLAATYISDFVVVATSSFIVRNNGKVILHMKKSAAVNCNLIIITPNTVDGLAVGDRTVVIPATTGDKFIGPFPPSIYNDANGDMEFTFSDVDGITGAILQT